MEESKFLALPLHHIDTSIIMERGTTENGRYCKRYLNTVGTKYRGVISFPVLSELFLIVLRLETFNERWDMFHLITSLVKEKKIGICTPINIFEIEHRIAEIDERIKPTDRQIASYAFENNSVLVTLDLNLLENQRLNKLGIEVKHPKNLI